MRTNGLCWSKAHQFFDRGRARIPLDQPSCAATRAWETAETKTRRIQPKSDCRRDRSHESDPTTCLRHAHYSENKLFRFPPSLRMRADQLHISPQRSYHIGIVQSRRSLASLAPRAPACLSPAFPSPGRDVRSKHLADQGSGTRFPPGAWTGAPGIACPQVQCPCASQPCMSREVQPMRVAGRGKLSAACAPFRRAASPWPSSSPDP